MAQNFICLPSPNGLRSFVPHERLEFKNRQKESIICSTASQKAITNQNSKSTRWFRSRMDGIDWCLFFVLGCEPKAFVYLSMALQIHPYLFT